MKLSEIVEIIGMLIFLAGIGWIWMPAALIFAGIFIIIFANISRKKGDMP